MATPTDREIVIGGDTPHAGDDMTADDQEVEGDQHSLSGGLSDEEGASVHDEERASAHDQLSDEHLNIEIPEIQPEGKSAADEANTGGATEADPQQTLTSSATTPEVPPDSEFEDGGATPELHDEHGRDFDMGHGDLDVGQGDLEMDQSDHDVGHGEEIQDGGDEEQDQTGADESAPRDNMDKGDQDLEDDTVEIGLAAHSHGQLQDLGPEAAHYAPPGTADGSHYQNINLGAGGLHAVGRKHISLAVNQSAIEASARNKLHITEVKGLVTRVSRPTESSSHKKRFWYKN